MDCAERNCLKVSGMRMSRTMIVRMMIAQPQLPITPWMPRRMPRSRSTRGAKIRPSVWKTGLVAIRAAR